jgi:hypothetical protein
MRFRWNEDARSQQAFSVFVDGEAANSSLHRYALFGGKNVAAVVVGESGPSLQNTLVFPWDSLDIFDPGDEFHAHGLSAMPNVLIGLLLGNVNIVVPSPCIFNSLALGSVPFQWESESGQWKGDRP